MARGTTAPGEAGVDSLDEEVQDVSKRVMARIIAESL